MEKNKWQKENHYESDFQITLCHLKLEQYEDVVTSVDRCIDRHNRFIPLLLMKLKALSLLDRVNEAIAAIDQSIDERPENLDLYFETARFLMQQGEYSQAERVCELAIDDHPKNIRFLKLYAQIGQKRIKPGKAA